MSWLNFRIPKPAPNHEEKRRYVDDKVKEVGVALRDLKRSLYHAESSRDQIFDPILAEVKATLRRSR